MPTFRIIFGKTKSQQFVCGYVPILNSFFPQNLNSLVSIDEIGKASSSRRAVCINRSMRDSYTEGGIYGYNSLIGIHKFNLSALLLSAMERLWSKFSV